ncbi:MAG: sugar transferase [Patescibacteria group bacterium]
MKIVYRFKQLVLLSGDLISFSLGFWISLAVRYFELPASDAINDKLSIFTILFASWVVINFINGLYDLGTLKEKKHYLRLLESATLSLFISIFILYLTPNNQTTPKTILLLNIIFGFLICYLWRLIYAKFIIDKNLGSRVIFIGWNREINELIEILSNHPERGYQPVVVFDPNNKITGVVGANITVYRQIQSLRSAINAHEANLIITEPQIQSEPQVLKELYELLFWPVRITELSAFYETITGRVPPSTFSDTWFLGNLANIDKPIYNRVKRFVDYVFAVILGLILLLILPLIVLAIKFSSHGPIFFKQARVGHFGAVFNIYKFRTMFVMAPDGSAEKNGAQFASKNDKRATSVGKFLRKTRLDELPQVINLFKGEITLIGPRPERPEIVANLESQMPYYTLRHMVKPGITGWAAIHQHYTDTLESTLKKLQFDLYYIKNRSILLDAIILLRTINVVMRMMGQ